ncbi:hypothetical protein ZWY2020_032567 [Hordeum vulgare]|nr:hypothetical protein ZWY2020_032567 [Hordeum vulgare]
MPLGQEAAKLATKYFAVPRLLPLPLLLLPPSTRSPPRPREAKGIVPPPGAQVDSGERPISAPLGSALGFRPRPRGRLAAGGSVAGARVSRLRASRPPRSRVSSSGTKGTARGVAALHSSAAPRQGKVGVF